MTEHEISRVVRTNAGMCAIWQPESFSFAEFEEWEDWATENENLVASAREGRFVPINVGGDGAFQIAVRWGAGAGLTEAERRCLLVESDPYLMISNGSLALGGLEDVGDAADIVDVAAGRYAVKVHLIDWKADPASVDASGKPTGDALPDFVVVLGPDSPGPFRTDVETFERPA